MDPQQLLATLIQLSDEQQQRIAELLNRLEQQTRTLTTASTVRNDVSNNFVRDEFLAWPKTQRKMHPLYALVGHQLN